MFGDDYPCWKTEDALRIIEDLNLSKVDKDKILGGNARRLFNLPEPVAPKVKEAAFA